MNPGVLRHWTQSGPAGKVLVKIGSREEQNQLLQSYSCEKRLKKPVVVGVSGALKGFAKHLKKPTKVKVPKIVKDLRALGGIKNVSSDL